MDALSKHIVDSLNAYSSKPFMKIKRGYFYNSLTYVQTSELIYKTITLLRDLNLTRGDKILIWGPNMPEWTVLFLACLLEGLVIIPANSKSGLDIVQKYVSQVVPKKVFISRNQSREIEDAIVMEDLFAVVRGLNPSEPSSEPVLDDLAEILYTSGTTGDPKGVILTRSNIIHELDSLLEAIEINGNISMMSILPMSHLYEQMIGLMYGMRVGASIFYLSYMTPAAISQSLKEFRPTHLVLVPQALKMFSDKVLYRFGQGFFRSVFDVVSGISLHMPFPMRRAIFYPIIRGFGGRLKMITLGGAKTDKNVKKMFSAMGINVVEGYGLTETSAAVSITTLKNQVTDSAGLSLKHAEIKISRDEEVLVRGPLVFKGYYNRPDLNAQYFDEEGFFHTGDIGYFNSDNELVLKGRQKFRIVLSNGEKVYPEDIEYRLRQVKGIKDAVVFALKRADSVEVAAAIILENAKYDLDSLVSIGNDPLESHQKITSYTLWPEDDFPRTSTLKVIRNTVESTATMVLLNKKALSYEAPSRSVVGLYKIISLAFSVEASALNEQTKLQEIKLDSLRRLSLVTLIEEEFGVLVAEEKINGSTDIASLRNLISHAPKSNTNKRIRRGIVFSRAFLPFRFLIVNIIVMSIWKLFMRVGYEGLENIPRQQAIFISNHPGIYDQLLIQRVLNRRGINTFIPTDDKHWKNMYGLRRVIDGWPSTLFSGCLPVSKTGGGVQSSFMKIGKLLESGLSMIIVPAGKYTFSHEDERDVKDGVILIARATGLPIVPCYIDQNFTNIMNPNGGRLRSIPKIKKNKVVNIKFGKPFYLPVGSDLPSDREIIWRSLQSL